MAELSILVAMLLTFGVPATPATPADQEAIRKICARFADSLVAGKLDEARDCFPFHSKERTDDFIFSQAQFLDAYLEWNIVQLKVDRWLGTRWQKSLCDWHSTFLNEKALNSWRRGVEVGSVVRIGPCALIAARPADGLHYAVLLRQVQGRWKLAAPPFEGADDYAIALKHIVFGNQSYAMFLAVNPIFRDLCARTEKGEIATYAAFVMEASKAMGGGGR